MKIHSLPDLLSCALEGAARYIVAYCDSAPQSEGNKAAAPSTSASAKYVKTVENFTKAEAERPISTPPLDADIPAPTDADAPPEKEPQESFIYGDFDLDSEKTDKASSESPEVAADLSEIPLSVVVDNVPADHPIHGEVSELLPGFRMLSYMVQKDDFVVTPQSVETAMPIWVAFNALSKYRDDENFPAILSYVRTHIKPVCFAAMGKEIAK
jgi:hypothetical protein